MARTNATPANTPACPPLPPGCVDLDALHSAALRGEDLSAVIAPPAMAVQALDPAPDAAE
ncbi:MAG: hypothetical protein ACT6Q7_02875 [Blastomonas fulva]|uniref:hypothetical protein n=1 Tax=Blastomonas fulva TaxID=1550728 RepID=UPI00403351DC